MKGVEETARAGYYEYNWLQEGERLRLKGIAKERGDLIGKMKIDLDPSKHLDMSGGTHVWQGKINMESVDAKKKWINALAKDVETVDWRRVIEYSCTNTLDKHEEGHPMVMIGNLPVRKEVPYMLHPLVRKDVPCILYGESGIGKSYVSLFISILITNGISAANMVPNKTAKILYLDWEDGEQNLDERLKALSSGLGISAPELHYQYMDGMLKDRLEMVSERIATYGIDMIIVDSKGASLGGRINEADATVQLFNSIRSLRITSLVIDHVAKQSAVGPIGSTFTVAEARNVWEMRSGEHIASNIMRVNFHHRKTNMSKKHAPFALEFTFEEDENEIVQSVSVEEIDVTDDVEARKGMGVAKRIELYLKDLALPDGTYESASVSTIVEAIESTNNTVRVRLSENVYDSKTNPSGWCEHAGMNEYKYREKDW